MGTYQETSPNATRQEILSHSRLGSLSHCGLILAQRVSVRGLLSTFFFLNAGGEGMVEHSPDILGSEGKATNCCQQKAELHILNDQTSDA